MATIAEQLEQVFARPIAHRGLHGCGRNGPAENTIAAALAAAAAGYGVECDVQLTRDGEAVVFHDTALDRLTEVAGRVDTLDAAEIAGLRLRDGSSVPTLRTFLTAIGGKAPVVVEIKSRHDADSRLADRVLRDVRDYRGAIALKSFDPFVVERCRDAGCPIGLVGPMKPSLHTDVPARRSPPLSRCDFLSWNVDDIHHVPSDTSDMPIMVWVVTGEDRRLETVREGGRQIVFEGFLP